MNKRCVALTDEQYQRCIELLRNGFVLPTGGVKGNPRIAAIGVLQATLGLRVGDILHLTLDSFVRDGDRYKLDIVEQKTGKLRNFTVPLEVYSFVQEYALQNKISSKAKLFDISDRQVERHLNKVFEKMELSPKSYGSHSFRKYFATKVYLENDCNIELVRVLLQHASVAVTQRYIGISQKTVEDALAKTISHLR